MATPPTSSNRTRKFAVMALALLFVLLLAGVSIWLIRGLFASKPAPVQLTDAQSTNLQPAPISPDATSGVPIGGIVQDEDGKPVPAARVNFQWHLPKPATGRAPVKTAHVITDSTGHWTFAGMAQSDLGSLAVDVAQKDFVNSTMELPPVETLLAGKAVFVLSRGFDISGQVVNSTGAPISGARMTTAASFHDPSEPNAKSDSQGGFVLHKVTGGEATVFVMAKGYAPAIAPIDSVADAKALKIVMSPGQTISGQIVDETGAPVEGATASFNFWNNMTEPRIRAVSDAQGHFDLRDLPGGQLSIVFQKSGYEEPFRNLTPGQEAPVVTLRLLPVFSGHVVDADTNQPIASFSAMVGTVSPRDRAPVFAFRSALPFKDGQYNLKSGGTSGEISTWYVRADADGYMPAVSEPVHSGGPIMLDLRMHRAPNIEVGVLDANDKPIAEAQMMMLLPSSSVNFSNGKSDPRLVIAQTGQSNAQGRFNFHPQIAPFEMWAIGESGCAQLTCVAYGGKPMEMRFSPWAQLRFHAVPIGKDSEPPSIGITPASDPLRLLNFSRWDYSGRPDANDDAFLKRIPSTFPEGLAIASWLLPEKGPLWGFRAGVVHLSAGQTTELDITAGSTVTGHVSPATPADNVGKAATAITLQWLPDGPAANWPADRLAAARAAPQIFGYSGIADEKGNFKIGGVTPGRYEYSVRPNTDPQVSCGSGLLTVPAGAGDFAAGELTYAKIPPLKIGDKAPAVLGRTPDEKPISAGDFAGRIVVWMVWNDGIGGHAADSPEATALANKFAADKRVALVAVNADRVTEYLSCPAMRPPAISGKAWTNGYLSLIDESLFMSLAVYQQAGPKVCIIPPDGKIAAMDLPADKIGDKLDELLATK